MESEPTMSPKPIVRTTSSAGPIPLSQPTPDFQSSQGSYASNVARLEETAERLSLGSNVGEEIRKIQWEQKQAESRRASVRSAAFEEAKELLQGRSRNTSTSSHADSVADVNIAARRGGFSNNAFGTPSASSGQSVPWSQPSHISVPNPESTSSRLRQIGGITQNNEPRSNVHATAPSSSQAAERDQDIRGKHTATSLQEDGIAQPNPRVQLSATQKPATEVPDRPPTAGSTDTYQQMGTLFKDFDGVHRPVARSIHRESMSPSPMLSAPHGTSSQHLLPNENMIYYPAPVPRMLNLPQRLSHVPPASVQATRRQQLVQSMAPEARHSAAWLSTEQVGNGGSEDHQNARQTKSRRYSTAKDLLDVPPQLRASAYFDHRAIGHEVEVKGDSAVKTLESILDASASAPVSAFTDHPFAGRVGQEVYGKEYGRDTTKRNTTSQLSLDKTGRRKSLSSMNLLFKRKSTDGLRDNLQQNNESRLSVPSRMDQASTVGKPNDMESRRGSQINLDDHGYTKDPDGGFAGENDQGQVGDGLIEAEPTNEEPVEYYGAPTTLLAELQIRKQQLRQRNRTAATAFPNGMHSTLLELDAVAQVEKKRRMGQRVALAWEDPDATGAEEANDGDEDVPLGVLFSSGNGLGGKDPTQPADWDRPLGLIERRELEDNEPLSSRRSRLLGIDPNRRHQVAKSQMRVSKVPEEFDRDENSSDDDGETLAQRARRLKVRESLDATVRPSSGEFASEMLDQFGISEESNAAAEAQPTTDNVNSRNQVVDADPDSEEETLAQRRKRLQAEALPQANQPLEGINDHRLSLANVLSAHPANSGPPIFNDTRRSTINPGSLLEQSERMRAVQRQQIYEQNRMSMMGANQQPLVNTADAYQGFNPATSGMIGNGYANGGGLMSAQQPFNAASPWTLPGLGAGYGNGMPMAGGGAGMYGYGAGAAPNHMGMPGFGSYGPAQPNAMSMVHSATGMGATGTMGALGAPATLNGVNAMTGMMGGATQMGAGMGGMNMGGATQMGAGIPGLNLELATQMATGIGMGRGAPIGSPPPNFIAPPMDQRQRKRIDEWRQNVEA